MKPEYEKAFELANLMSVLANQKRALQEEYQQSLIYFHNGGTFKVTRELISFVSTLISVAKLESSVLTDDSGNPIDVENLQEFLEAILNTYASASNSYLSRYQKLKSNKSITSILNV